MYRQPYLGSFRYVCGHDQQSHGAQCHRDHVDGLIATRFLLGCIRQRLLTSGIRDKLAKRRRELSERDRNREIHDQR
jgi:hypothetical protein